MGKKKDKLAQQQQGSNVPWQQIDRDPLSFLVAPQTADAFHTDNWEQQPAVFKATPERIALFQGLCSLPAVLNWLKQREKKAGPLEFGVDVNAARYKDGVRENPNGDVADADTLEALHNLQGCTLQLHQPQRFFDPCWRLLAALERQLGCLVGSNAYLTPKGSQGLAPHHDDVELWVVQTAGTKAWRVYGPLNGYRLPNQPSGDLDQEGLADPVLEVELGVGDVMYLPRGAVHQAIASGSSDSSHLTISTYQRSSYADLATHLLQVGLRAQDEPDCLPLAARHSPLPGTILQHSLHKVLAPTNNGSTTPDAVAGLAKALRAIADKLEGTPDMLTGAIHSFAMDFLINRLPPHPKQLPGRGNAPTISDRIWCRLAGWSYLLPFEVTGMNCEDDEVAGLEEGSVKIVSCLMNSREEHMITMPDEFEDESNSSSGSGEGTSEEAASTDKEEVQSGGSQQASGAAAVEPSASGAAAVEPSANEAAAGASSDEEGQGKQWQQDAQPLAAVSEGTKGNKAAKQSKQAALDHEPESSYGEHTGEHNGGHCCGDEACGAGACVAEPSMNSGAERENPVATLPGLVLEPGVLKAVVAFMAAESPEQAVHVQELPLTSDAAKLQFAFALWAEGFAACVAGQKQKQDGSKPAAGKKGKRSTAAAAADNEETATSSGKRCKKAKAT
eukprot:GHRR01000573.1.p1 GENE.GHRR01000573.1~~GHRR01000573.1.p1  ORF type:complete len:692 (+),score=292.63 GHRR01000573.1:55-2076(+)